MKIKDKRIVVYVNFSPYVNAGKILDYITDTFETVLVFSFNFYSLGRNQERNSLSIYKNRKLVKKNYLHQMRSNKKMSTAFLLLPVRSIILFLQITWHLLRFKKTYKTYDIFFTVNAFPAWIGNFLRQFHLIDKTIYWVWDYYPPMHKNKIVMLFRWMYWQLDRSANKSDSVVYLNQRLIELRKSIGVWNNNINSKIIPIGTDPRYIKKQRNMESIKLVFVGVLKKSQGLDIVFDNATQLVKMFPKISIDIIGSGPDEAYFKRRSGKTMLKTTFHGFLPNENAVDKIISNCHIGVATYIPEESNVSYYGDPSKIKLYISQGIPVITTDVFSFSEEILYLKAGIIVDYFKPGQLVAAIKEINSHKSFYEKNALRLAKKYNFKKIYADMFNI